MRRHAGSKRHRPGRGIEIAWRCSCAGRGVVVDLYRRIGRLAEGHRKHGVHCASSWFGNRDVVHIQTAGDVIVDDRAFAIGVLNADRSRRGGGCVLQLDDKFLKGLDDTVTDDRYGDRLQRGIGGEGNGLRRCLRHAHKVAARHSTTVEGVILNGHRLTQRLGELHQKDHILG